MKKSDYICAAIAVVLLGGAALLQLPGREAAAQAGGVYVNAVDLGGIEQALHRLLRARQRIALFEQTRIVMQREFNGEDLERRRKPVRATHRVREL